jgi:hypothetical protein
MQNNAKIYTDKNFKDLINSLKNIKEKTFQQNDTGDDFKKKIYEALDELEKIYDYKPSYKNFVNKMISQENIKDAENNIIKELEEKNMIGYTPELKILIQKIATQENIDKTKNYYVEEFRTLNAE